MVREIYFILDRLRQTVPIHVVQVDVVRFHEP